MTLYQTLVVDPPWEFCRKPRCVRPAYQVMDLDAIRLLPIRDMSAPDSHLYLWVPNALLAEGLSIMAAWGFDYKTMLVWAKHQVGCGNYFRGSTEPILFGVRGVSSRRTVRARLGHG